jgi:hypothetical protein
MARKSGHNKPYLRKGGGRTFKYKWGPFQDLPKDINDRAARRRKDAKPSAKCNATPGSQGFDNKVTYVYKVFISEDGVNNGAYVECDYVE